MCHIPDTPSEIPTFFPVNRMSTLPRSVSYDQVVLLSAFIAHVITRTQSIQRSGQTFNVGILMNNQRKMMHLNSQNSSVYRTNE